tara:strand:+ start:63 stop:281 length:219 start_codon:yes stop_codon:yes gene_type:complete
MKITRDTRKFRRVYETLPITKNKFQQYAIDNAYPDCVARFCGHTVGWSGYYDCVEKREMDSLRESWKEDKKT